MNHETLRLLQIGTGTTLLGAAPVLMGWVEPHFLLATAVLGFAPLLFLGLLAVGIKGDELLGVDDGAWSFNVPQDKKD